MRFPIKQSKSISKISYHGDAHARTIVHLLGIPSYESHSLLIASNKIIRALLGLLLNSNPLSNLITALESIITLMLKIFQLLLVEPIVVSIIFQSPNRGHTFRATSLCVTLTWVASIALVFVAFESKGILPVAFSMTS